MTTLKHILLFLAAGSLLVACHKEDDFARNAQGTQPAEGKVIVNGMLSLPISEDQGWATKAFREVPEVKRLYLVVFNEGDIVYEIVKAKPGTQSHPTNPDAGFTCGDKSTGYLTQFHAELTSVAQGDRYIHFIAASEPIATLETGSVNMMDEGTFVRNLVTTGGVVAYWGREHYTSITETTEMHNILMIRNFSKVKVNVDSGVTNFSIQGFKVFNTPVYGTIAPFNNNRPDYITVDGKDQINFDRFANYKEAVSKDSPYTFLKESDGYYGYMPPIISYDDLSANYTTTSDTMTWLDPSDADYLYECSYRPDRNPFIIMKATYEGNTYYYKADFVFPGPSGNEYYNILRNFQYTLNITGVNGKGSDTVFDAVNSIALNNFEASTESQALTNIALDNSRLYVSKTDILVTSGTTLTMYVKSRTGDDFSTNDNNSLEGKILQATSGENIVTEDAKISIAGSDETSGAYSGWRKVTITIADPSSLHQGEVWKQPIVFKNAAGLTRTVNLTIRRAFPLTVDMQDVVAGTKDTECELTFTVPAGLTEFRFPMYFYIEQEANNLYPKALPDGANEALSVETGTSLIPEHTGNNYYYRRTITWDEYKAVEADINGIKTFSCYFKTLVPESATTVWVIPAKENDYFHPYDDVENEWTNKDAFLNNKLKGKVTFPYSGIQIPLDIVTTVGETEVHTPGTETVVATTNSDGAITYSSSNPSVAKVDGNGKVTAVGLGTATITASVEESGSYTAASASYSVTVTDGALCNLQMNWRYEPVYVVKTGSSILSPVIDAAVDSGYSVEVAYSTSSEDGGAVSVDETDAESRGYVTIRGTSVGTVTVKATATVKDASSNVVLVRSMSYDIQVVASHPEKGTVFHDETFLKSTFGDYTIRRNKVTDGATYNEGTDVTELFHTYTSVYDVPRYVWFPYYNPSTGTNTYGAAASALGSIQPSEQLEDSGGNLYTEYYRAYRASICQLASKNIDLSTSAGATLTFYHAGNSFFKADRSDIANAQANMQADVCVRFSKDGGATWSDKQTIKHWPAGSNYVYVRTAVDIPSDYLVSNFQVMFEYTSTNTRGGTWEVRNVKITEN